MRVGLSLLAILLLVGGCASKPAMAPTAVTPRTAAAYTRPTIYTNHDLRFSVTFDASRLVERPNPLGPATVLFVDRDARDRPFGPSRRRGSLYIFALRNDYTPTTDQPSPADARAAMKAWMKFYELGLRRAPNAVKGPVAARVAPLVFKGLSGYQAAFSWDRGSEIVYRVSNGLYVYGFILNVGNSVGPTERQATYQALQSFTVTK